MKITQFPTGKGICLTVEEILDLLSCMIQKNSLSILWENDSTSTLFCLRKAIEDYSTPSNSIFLVILEPLHQFVLELDSKNATTINTRIYFDVFIEILLDIKCEVQSDLIESVLCYLNSFHPRSKADLYARRFATNQSISLALLHQKKFWRAAVISAPQEFTTSFFKDSLLYYLQYKGDDIFKEQVFDYIEEAMISFERNDSTALLETLVYLLQDLLSVNVEKTIALASFFSTAPVTLILKILTMFPNDLRIRFDFLEICLESMDYSSGSFQDLLKSVFFINAR